MPKKEVININSCSTRGQQYELKVASDSLPLKLCNSFWLIICRKAFFQSKHILPTIFWLYIPPFYLFNHQVLTQLFWEPQVSYFQLWLMSLLPRFSFLIHILSTDLWSIIYVIYVIFLLYRVTLPEWPLISYSLEAIL